MRITLVQTSERKAVYWAQRPLPSNRTPGTPTCEKNLRANTSGKIAMKNPPKHEIVDGFPSRARAFFIPFIYRAAVNSALALSMTKYVDHIAQQADIQSGATFLNGRSIITSNLKSLLPTETVIFSSVKKKRKLLLSRIYPIQSVLRQWACLRPAVRIVIPGTKMFLVGQNSSHHEESPLYRMQRQRKPSVICGSVLYFVTSAVGRALGARTWEVCYKWSSLQCARGPHVAPVWQHHCTHCHFRFHCQDTYPNRTMNSTNRAPLRHDQFRCCLQYHRTLKLWVAVVNFIKFVAYIGYHGLVRTVFWNNIFSGTVLPQQIQKRRFLTAYYWHLHLLSFPKLIINSLGVVDEKNSGTAL